MTTARTNDAQIAEAAYFLWLNEGKPEGRDAAHWHQAYAALADDAEPAKRKPARSKAAAKPAAKTAGKAAPKAKAKPAAKAPAKAAAKTKAAAKPRKRKADTQA